ncbi:MAG: hypothetical protein ACOYYJ_21605, partial [Chloroflexota bacterium]
TAKKHPDFLGALGCCGLSLWFVLFLLDLFHAPTSRHRTDTGSVIGIIRCAAPGGGFHNSRKHTTVSAMRQANCELFISRHPGA